MNHNLENKVWVFNDEVIGEQLDSGVQRKVLAYCEKVMCVEHYFDEGDIGALHTHPNTQITYVVDGEFEFTISGETKIVKKGDAMLKQDGVTHGCKCIKKGILLDIFVPMRTDFVK
ncbi:Cupin domain-containing protein [Geosporobacter subterraneus DSM 17957]|uniref:Cupin domain-containing protein n=1 Tax=Geosporobacter subterraneus DSM 17957 TaxID=1121919 RepID=A0A1M6I7Y1_9FIRM|nr:cupin domain-containing protein [Geosporobacter subterraneus]SHJ30587.1 Cupin domain-containing protein [Geosporobacter subterraneus DSM 17957]